MKGNLPMTWETPKPIQPQPPSVHESPGLLRREMSAISQETPQPQSFPILKDEKLQKSLLRHQQEMERLIKNISARIHLHAPVQQSTTLPSNNAMLPNEDDKIFSPQLDFDFTLRRHTGHDAIWQSVAGASHKFYVYSAYYDTRGPRPHVRVIGATKTKRSDKVWCRLYYRDNKKSITVPGTVSVIRENWNLKYSACFVICVLPTDQKTGSNTFIVGSRGASQLGGIF